MTWWRRWQALSRALELTVDFSCRVSVEARSCGSTVSTSCRALIARHRAAVRGQPPGLRPLQSEYEEVFWDCVKALAECRSKPLRASLLLVSMCQWVLCNQN